MTTGGGGGYSSDINMTPMIDILLVLLIIFMVIVPVTPKGLDALVPQPPKDKNSEPDPTTIVVSIKGGNGVPVSYLINQDAFNKSDLEPKLQAIYAVRSNKIMFVKGDPNLNYSTVEDVIDMGKQAGVDNIGIITPKVEQGD
jgi:biopolymer transport protein ExbD